MYEEEAPRPTTRTGGCRRHPRRPRTWEQVAAAARLGDDELGLILLDLLARKEVKTLHRGGVRVYLPP